MLPGNNIFKILIYTYTHEFKPFQCCIFHILIDLSCKLLDLLYNFIYLKNNRILTDIYIIAIYICIYSLYITCIYFACTFYTRGISLSYYLMKYIQRQKCLRHHFCLSIKLKSKGLYWTRITEHYKPNALPQNHCTYNVVINFAFVGK